MADREVVVGTLDGEPLRAAFPLRVTMFGIDAVVIPEAEYGELTAVAAAAKGGRRASKRPPRPSTLAQDDPEVAAFFQESFLAGATIEAAERACRERFGKERTPSYGRVQRFRLAVLAERDGTDRQPATTAP